MSSNPTWKLVNGDESVDEFIDIRRKVGNQIIRAYLLKNLMKSDRVQRIPGRLRGPKNEFKDFDKFLILKVDDGSSTTRFLAESGVYENLRIVGTDSEDLAVATPEEITDTFTTALQEPEQNGVTLILSHGSKVR
ncbi:hypothetical protein EU545_01815 [Candidatus Thorarchaeota archaeon]|nr:MAG: hypothetical protein EU545_01815 [Candidatus Thorarchaeota archaeon]